MLKYATNPVISNGSGRCTARLAGPKQRKEDDMTHWTTRLTDINACEEAVVWARSYDTPQQAWEACERPDWMLWVAAKLAMTEQEHQNIVIAAAACARTALQYVRAGETRPLAAIEAAERWAWQPTR